MNTIVPSNAAVGNSTSLIARQITKALTDHCFAISVGEADYRVVVSYSTGKVSTAVDTDQHQRLEAIVLRLLSQYKLTRSSKRNTKDQISRTLYMEHVDAPKPVPKPVVPQSALPAPKPKVVSDKEAKAYIAANLKACARDMLARAQTGALRHNGPIIEVDRLLGRQGDASKAIRLIQQACVAFVANGK